MSTKTPPFALGYWWTIGLEMEAGWVKEPTAVDFLGDKYWLRPGKDTALPDISIAAPDATSASDYLHRARRFLSLLCWFDDRRIIESTHIGSGGPVPCLVGNMQASNIKSQYTMDMDLRVEMLPAVPSDEAWLALALYREAL